MIYTEEEKQLLITAKEAIKNGDERWILKVDDYWLNFSDKEEDYEKKKQVYLDKGFYDILHKIYEQKMIIEVVVKHLKEFEKINKTLPDFLQDEMVELVKKQEEEDE